MDHQSNEHGVSLFNLAFVEELKNIPGEGMEKSIKLKNLQKEIPNTSQNSLHGNFPTMRFSQQEGGWG